MYPRNNATGSFPRLGALRSIALAEARHVPVAAFLSEGRGRMGLPPKTPRTGRQGARQRTSVSRKLWRGGGGPGRGVSHEGVKMRGQTDSCPTPRRCPACGLHIRIGRRRHGYRTTVLPPISVRAAWYWTCEARHTGVDAGRRRPWCILGERRSSRQTSTFSTRPPPLTHYRKTYKIEPACADCARSRLAC